VSSHEETSHIKLTATGSCGKCSCIYLAYHTDITAAWGVIATNRLLKRVMFYFNDTSVSIIYYHYDYVTVT